MRAPAPKVVLGGLAVLLAAAAAVVAVHLAATPPAPIEELMRDIPGLGSRMLPNLVRAEVEMTGRPHPLGAGPVDEQSLVPFSRRLTYRCSTTAFAHRNGPVRARPLPGTTRIVCYGGSLTFGHGVDDGQDYPAVLRQLLRRHGKFEVINAGNPGEPSILGARVLERLIIPIRPRLVIIGLGVRDITDWFEPANESIHYPAQYEQIGEGLKSRLEQMITLLRRNKIRAALVVPPLTSFFPYPEHRHATAAVRALGKQLGVPVFDPGETFRRQERRHGLVLQMVGQTRQALVAYSDGKPRQLLQVPVKTDRTPLSVIADRRRKRPCCITRFHVPGQTPLITNEPSQEVVACHCGCELLEVSQDAQLTVEPGGLGISSVT